MVAMAAILGFDRNDISYFWSTSCPDTSYQVLSQCAYGSLEEAQNEFPR